MTLYFKKFVTFELHFNTEALILACSLGRVCALC